MPAMVQIGQLMSTVSHIDHRVLVRAHQTQLTALRQSPHSAQAAKEIPRRA